MKSLLGILAVVLTLCACGKEGEVKPLYHDPAQFFMPADDATDPTSMLRRDFQKKHGSYLLFNDTIQKSYAGKDINGNDVYQWETVQIDYSVGKNGSDDEYTFTYLNDYYAQKAMSEYLEEYVLYHCQGKMKPFSWFLCDVIKGKTVSGKAVTPYVASGQRCTGVACNYLLQRERTELQKNQYAQRILLGLITTLANNFREYFDEFFQYSSGFYDANVDAESAEERTHRMKSHGFLTLYLNIYYPSQDSDLSSFAQASLSYTEEEFEKNNGEYPLVMAKYRCVKRTLESLGFVY